MSMEIGSSCKRLGHRWQYTGSERDIRYCTRCERREYLRTEWVS